jgi:hypothetical protein
MLCQWKKVEALMDKSGARYRALSDVAVLVAWTKGSHAEDVRPLA